jgi:hypothetical protein
MGKIKKRFLEWTFGSFKRWSIILVITTFNLLSTSVLIREWQYIEEGWKYFILGFMLMMEVVSWLHPYTIWKKLVKLKHKDVWQD